MANISIRVENLGKLYRLGEVGTGTISHDLNRWWARLLGKEDPFAKVGEVNDRTLKGKGNYVWAVKDVNFEVKEGEVLGIIGRNGAGKSTLLKLLSKVTQPTEGHIKIRGRIASLLEVGTGFHPEMTGRENIFQNGAILGMTKSEIKSKFDEIVDFSGVERYIDTPVKRYSSGMYVRLAFAVAAHLEPEILIVDEVLAVGDAEFQKKCLGKMKDVSVNDGRTVLFVSHNMAAIKSLCTRTLLMEFGQVKMIDTPDRTVSYYLKGNMDRLNRRVFDNEFGNEDFQLHEISLNAIGKSNDEPLVENEEIELRTRIYIKDGMEKNYHVTYHLHNEEGEPIFSFSHEEVSLRTGPNHIICSFPKYFFNSGTFYLSVFIVKDKARTVFFERDVTYFTVVDGGREMGVYMGREPGYIKPTFAWKHDTA